MAQAESVKLYRSAPAGQKYTTIGTVDVSTRNLFGIKRQKANIRHLLQEKASAMGGNAVIHCQWENNQVEGEVISLKSNQKHS